MSGSAEFELLRVQRLVVTEFQLSTDDASLAVYVLETCASGRIWEEWFRVSRTDATMRERLVVVDHVGLTKGEPY